MLIFFCVKDDLYNCFLLAADHSRYFRFPRIFAGSVQRPSVYRHFSACDASCSEELTEKTWYCSFPFGQALTLWNEYVFLFEWEVDVFMSSCSFYLHKHVKVLILAMNPWLHLSRSRLEVTETTCQILSIPRCWLTSWQEWISPSLSPRPPPRSLTVVLWAAGKARTGPEILDTPQWLQAFQRSHSLSDCGRVLLCSLLKAECCLVGKKMKAMHNVKKIF